MDDTDDEDDENICGLDESEVYCCLCGGPSVDVCNRVSRFAKSNPNTGYDNEDEFYWLQDCTALTVYGNIDGGCPGDGTLEGDAIVCVAKSSWGTIPSKAEKKEYLDCDSDLELPGIVMHRVCWEMFKPKCAKMSVRTLFLELSQHIMEKGQLFMGVKYGDVVSNHGQAYYTLKPMESGLISFPDCILEIHDINITKDNGPGRFNYY
jgi:hypothetical protein